jgi:hypothetical protein
MLVKASSASTIMICNRVFFFIRIHLSIYKIISDDTAMKINQTLADILLKITSFVSQPMSLLELFHRPEYHIHVDFTMRYKIVLILC